MILTWIFDYWEGKVTEFSIVCSKRFIQFKEKHHIPSRSQICWQKEVRIRKGTCWSGRIVRLVLSLLFAVVVCCCCFLWGSLCFGQVVLFLVVVFLVLGLLVCALKQFTLMNFAIYLTLICSCLIAGFCCVFWPLFPVWYLSCVFCLLFLCAWCFCALVLVACGFCFWLFAGIPNCCCECPTSIGNSQLQLGIPNTCWEFPTVVRKSQQQLGNPNSYWKYPTYVRNPQPVLVIPTCIW